MNPLRKLESVKASWFNTTRGCLRLMGKQFDLSLIFSVFLYVLNSKIRKKWPGISKVYWPILDNRMLCVLSNNILVFNSSSGTPRKGPYSPFPGGM